MRVFALLAIAVALAASGAAAQQCTEPLPPSYKYTNVFGLLELAWSANQTDVTFELTLPGSAWIGLGVGYGMIGADIVLAWVNEDGSVHADDRFATKHAPPQTDVSQGGHNNIVALCGSRDPTTNMTTVRFSRPLAAADPDLDKAIVLGENDFIYAWSNSGPPGTLKYHGDNHNHIQVDLTLAHGVPDSRFGEEETGFSARQLLQKADHGTLVTIHTQDMVGSPSIVDYPYGSVAGFADTVPSSGQPILLLSHLERNIINYGEVKKASLAVEQPPPLNGTDVMASPRFTLMGTLNKVPASELDHAKSVYIARHPESEIWADFSDFNFYYFNSTAVYWVGGFGNAHYIGWISPEVYGSWVL